MKNMLYSVLFICISFSVFAQKKEIEFKVLCHNGMIKVNNVAVVTGQSISKSDKLTLTVNSFIGLLHVSGKTIEIKQAGIYDCKKLVEMVTSKTTSVSQKYLNFVYDEVTKDNTVKEYRARMQITASVERNTSIKVCLPLKFHFISSAILPIKCQNPTKLTYTLEIYDEENTILFSKKSNDSIVFCDLASKSILNNTCFLRIYTDKEDKESITSYKLLQYLNDSLFKSTLEEKQFTSIDYFTQAMYFEQNDLFLNAYNSYNKAIKLNPSCKECKMQFNEFLKSNGLKSFIVK